MNCCFESACSDFRARSAGHLTSLIVNKAVNSDEFPGRLEDQAVSSSIPGFVSRYDSWAYFRRRWVIFATFGAANGLPAGEQQLHLDARCFVAFGYFRSCFVVLLLVARVLSSTVNRTLRLFKIAMRPMGDGPRARTSFHQGAKKIFRAYAQRRKIYLGNRGSFDPWFSARRLWHYISL